MKYKGHIEREDLPADGKKMREGSLERMHIETYQRIRHALWNNDNTNGQSSDHVPAKPSEIWNRIANCQSKSNC